MFDLAGAFVGARILESSLLRFYPTKLAYYASVIPVGVVIHFIIGQRTFLNDKIFAESGFNRYHFLVFFMMVVVIANRKR